MKISRSGKLYNYIRPFNMRDQCRDPRTDCQLVWNVIVATAAYWMIPFVINGAAIVLAANFTDYVSTVAMYDTAFIQISAVIGTIANVLSTPLWL